MNARERYLATAAGTAVDRTFLIQPWMWGQTLARWHEEGLPAGISLAQYFQTDEEWGAPVAMQGPYGPHLLPPFAEQVLEETGEYRVVRDAEGNTLRMFRDDAGRSMPEWIAYPMKDRRDWEALVKPRLDAAVVGRCPRGAELQAYAEKVRVRENPLGVWCGSLYGWPRSLMGVERISYTFFDDPGLIHEMAEHILEFVIATLTPVVQAVQFDFAYYWEDMAGKGGPLCSPALYRRFMQPRLRRLGEFLRGHGIRHLIVDSDGDNDALVPLWLEAGFDGLRPFEIAAGSDPVASRRRYGRSLVIQGGIDKRALAGGEEAIDREVLSKVPWLCLQGGYFPQVDHLVPPDVSLANYLHYARLLRQVAEDPERHLREARQRGLWKE